jgi:FG-GAP-like repeat
MNKLSNIIKTVTALFILVILAACSSSPAEPTSEAALEPQSFNGFSKWHEFFCAGNEYCQVGKFNSGDRRDDIISFNQSSAKTLVALSTGDRFNPSQVWTASGCANGQACRVGDVDGDRDDDVIIFERNHENASLHGDVYVQLSNGSSFGSKQKWHDNFCTDASWCLVGDFNGDGKADLFSFLKRSRGYAFSPVDVALSTGTRFGTASQRHDLFCWGDAICDIGDFNGDGKADIAAFFRNSPSESWRGDVWVALSNGSTYGPSQLWRNAFCVNQETCAVGNVAGGFADNKDDIIAFVHSDSGSGGTTSRVKIASSTGFSFGATTTQLGGFCFFKGSMCMAGNFNDSDKEDLVSFVRDTFSGSFRGDVYVALSAYEPPENSKLKQRQGSNQPSEAGTQR